MITAAVLTISDKGSQGQREDTSGNLVEKMLRDAGIDVLSRRVVPDETPAIIDSLREFVRQHDLVVTTGGTGVTPRDVTPEATLEVIDRELPGFAEAMRMAGFKKTPRAIISRAVAGVAASSLIVNLPGSPNGVGDSLSAILPAVTHTVEMIKGQGGQCAPPQ